MKKIESIDEVKALYAGLGEQWSITKVMNSLGFNIVTGNNYEGLFHMLSAGRFDYFPRGLNEVFKEYGARKNKFPKMIIEPNISLYIPIPTYFFVSPARPELADRIEMGMNAIISDGTFDIAFNKEFGDFIDAANLKQRKTFRVSNPDLSDETPLDNQTYWLNY